GVLLYAGTGVYALAVGQPFLDYDAIDLSDPQHGQHMGLLLIEFGVGLTVSSTILLIFYTFAGRQPPR
ncbi:MAG: MnhB domain-containing protein, partial [Oceanococcaceae bacterium]